MNGPFLQQDGCLRVALKVTPRAKRDAVAGCQGDADGLLRLKVSVTAVPEDGKANAAVVKLLARHWRVPKTAISVVAGATDRRKTVEVAGDAEALCARLTQWLDAFT